MRTSIDGISPSQSTNRRSEYGRRLVVPTRSAVVNATQVFSTPSVTSQQKPISDFRPIARHPELDSGASHTRSIPTGSQIKSGMTVGVASKARISDESQAIAPAPQTVQQISKETTPQKRSWFTRPHVIRWSFSTIAVLILAITGVLGYQTWQTNSQAHAILDKPISSTVGAGSTSNSEPSQAPVSDAAKKAYAVAPDMPRMLSIPSIGVSARILRLSVTNDGAIQAPNSIWDTGWYDGSSKPGESGNAFIDGHISYPGTPAVFTKLHTLKNGASITIQRGNGSNLTYSVVSVTTQKLSDINMSTILVGPGGTDQTLTIMTCAGTIKSNEFDSRTVVVAKRTS